MEGKTMRIGVPKERLANETRVAATPKTVEQLLKLGFTVAIESGAGTLASFDDEAFTQAGADVVDGAEVWQSPIILKVNAPEESEIGLLNAGTTLVSFVWPAQNPELMEKLAARGVTVMAMDSVPRISRAQSLDALSSMANIAGYRAIVEAAHEFGRFFTGQITAAGKVPPAKVMVIGAGVAGLAAIGAANSLGAIVRAFDTRPEVKEQVTATIEIREVFNITKVGLVAGAMVKTGKVKRSDKARLIRDGIVIFTGNINALKRFKDDVKEVGTNFECGISLVNCNDMKVGDMIETFEEIEVKQTL